VDLQSGKHGQHYTLDARSRSARGESAFDVAPRDATLWFRPMADDLHAFVRAPEAPVPNGANGTSSRRRHEGVDEPVARRWLGPVVAVALTMTAASIAVLVLTGMQSNAIYSKPVDQLLGERAKFIGRPVRAEGNLVHGSLEKRDQPCEYRFTIAKNGAERGP